MNKSKSINISGWKFFQRYLQTKTNKEQHNNQSPTRIQNIQPTVTQINQIKVVSIDAVLPSSVSRLAITFHAGARFENASNAGITHFIRRFVGLRSIKATNFHITRTIQQAGGNLYCICDREFISIFVVVRREALHHGFNAIRHAATHHRFNAWEIADNVHYIKDDIERMSGATKSMEMLHHAAFRYGLGNSIYCPEHNSNGFSAEQLQSYCSEFLSANRCTIAGVNVSPKELESFAGDLSFSALGKKPAPEQSKFKGGEIRLHTAGNLAHVSVATEGTLLHCTSMTYIFAVLQHIWGVGPSINFSTMKLYGCGLLSRKIEEALPGEFYICRGINVSYSDGGLFGFQITADKSNIRKALTVAMDAFRQSNSFDEKTVEMGKMKLKNEILFNLESEQAVLEEMSGQTMISEEKLITLSGLLAEIDAISVKDVNKVGKYIAEKKNFAMSAVGNLENVPYLDEVLIGSDNKI